MRIGTQTVYAFETLIEELAWDVDPRSWAFRWVSFVDARQLLARVWAESGSKRDAPPLVRWGRIHIVPVASAGYYHYEDHYISLHPTMRSRSVLLHEITHALGYLQHDRRFLTHYIDLLVRYARCDPAHLTILHGLMGIRL